MKNFNLKRFGQALKCQFMVTRHSWIRLFGIYTFVMFMANLFFTRLAWRDYDDLAKNFGEDIVSSTYRHIVDQTSVFGVIFFCFAMLFGACYLFSQLKDTRKRSAYLLWPVSNLEKYIICLLHSIVLMLIITVGAYLLADALRVLVDFITGRVIIWGFPMSFNVDPEHNTPCMLLLFAFGMVFYIHSLYILGGTLFRRQQFLFTSIIFLIGLILVIMLLKQSVEWFDWNPGEMISYHGDEYHFHWTFYMFTILFYLLIAIHYWLSYRSLCRMQVINNKWLNV